MSMKQVILAAALLLAPIAAYAQAPDVASQADSAVVQGTRILALLSGQIAQDQATIKALNAKVEEMQKQLDAKAKPEAAPPK